MPTIFGSLTLVGIYLWARLIFRRESTAIWVALLTMVNAFLFVTGRIAMLDVFMFAFTLFGMVAVCALWAAHDKRQSNRLLLIAGLMFGLGMACKWVALAAWAFSLVGIVFVRILQHAGSTLFRARRPDIEEWYTPETFRYVGWGSLVVCLVVLPVIVYSATFVPLRWVPGPNASWSGLVRMQRDIVHAHATVERWHPYSSFWWQWPATRRPMWYAYEADPEDIEYGRGVILLGNPVVMWGGLIALAICLWHWLRDRSRATFFAFAWWAALYFCWTWVPRHLTFYYYYYPAAMTLGIALAYVFQHWGEYRFVRWGQWLLLVLAIVTFIGLYPFLADVRMPTRVMPVG